MVQAMVAKKCYTPSRWWLTLQYFWKDNTSKQLLKPFLAVAMRVLYDRGIKQSIQRWESDLLWHTVHQECFFFCSKIVLSAQHSCNLWKKMTDTDFQFDRAVDHFHQSVRFFCVTFSTAIQLSENCDYFTLNRAGRISWNIVTYQPCWFLLTYQQMTSHLLMEAVAQDLGWAIDFS